jgi:hypothetical protein
MSVDVSQAAAMMSESRYAIVVVDSATACYRYQLLFFRVLFLSQLLTGFG